MKKMFLLTISVFSLLGSMEGMQACQILMKMSYFHQYDKSPSCLTHVSFDDKTYLITGFDSGNVNLSLIDGTKIFDVPHGSNVTAIAGIANKKLWIISATSTGSVKVWNSCGKLVNEFTCDSSIHTIIPIKFQNGGIWIAAGTKDKTYLFDIFNGFCDADFYDVTPIELEHSESCQTISILEREDAKPLIIAGLASGTIEVWNLEGDLRQRITMKSKESDCCEIISLASCYFQDSTYIIAGLKSGEVVTKRLVPGPSKNFHYKDFLSSCASDYGISDVELLSHSFNTMNGEFYLLSRHKKHLYLFNVSNFLQDQDYINCGCITNRFPTYDCRCIAFFTTPQGEYFLATGVVKDPENSSASMVIINKIELR